MKSMYASSTAASLQMFSIEQTCKFTKPKPLLFLYKTENSCKHHGELFFLNPCAKRNCCVKQYIILILICCWHSNATPWSGVRPGANRNQIFLSWVFKPGLCSRGRRSEVGMPLPTLLKQLTANICEIISMLLC